MLHVFPSFEYGGQQTRFAALARGLGAGFSHHVVALNGEAAARKLIPDGLSVSYASFRARKSRPASVSNILRLRKIIREVKPDLLCTYNWGAIEAVAANRLGRNVRHIHFEDGFGPDETPESQTPRRVLARRFLLRRGAVVVPSRMLEETAVERWKLSADRVLRVPNGVDCARFKTAPRPSGGAVTVGAVGALRPEKNHARLIRLFLKADAARCATLIIIGDGPERARLNALVKELGAEARVKLPGAASAVEKAYNRFDVFALSSDTEQAPVSLMEAMAAGLPVVSTNVGDVAQMVSGKNRACVTEPGDDEAYVYALAHLLQSREARVKIGAENRRKAAAEFSLEKMLRTHRSLYLSMARSGAQCGARSGAKAGANAGAWRS